MTFNIIKPTKRHDAIILSAVSEVIYEFKYIFCTLILLNRRKFYLFNYRFIVLVFFIHMVIMIDLLVYESINRNFMLNSLQHFQLSYRQIRMIDNQLIACTAFCKSFKIKTF